MILELLLKVTLCLKVSLSINSFTPINSRIFFKDATEQEVIDIIKELVDDNEVNGILVQLPLPKHMNEDKVIFSF